MHTELVFPSRVEPNDRLHIDYFDESDRSGTLVVGPFDVLTQEVHSND